MIITIKPCEFCGKPKKPDGQKYCHECAPERRAFAIKHFYGTLDNMVWVDRGGGYFAFVRKDEVDTQGDIE